MSETDELFGSGERFSEVLEAQIEAGEGLFEDPHPFLRTACRGLAKRLGNDELAPIGLVHTTELYIYDMSTGEDGFTGEPMPAEVKNMPPFMRLSVRIAARHIAREAFGEDFVTAVSQHYEEIRQAQSATPA